MRTFAIGLIALGAAYGQAGLQSPYSGYVFDESAHVLRAIQGIPGAALVGAPVDFGFPVTAAVVSPRLDSAIVLDANASPHIFKLNAGNAVEALAMDAPAGAAIVYSPSGGVAALIADHSVQVIKGLPDNPVAGTTVPLHGVSKTIAISDDGAYLISSMRYTVELVGIGGDSRKLMDTAPGALAAFAPGSHDAAVIHAETLSLIQDVAGAATQRDFPGMGQPSAIAYSADGRTVFTAGARAQKVAATSVDSGDTTQLDCGCSPSLLAGMGPLFRLTEFGGSPLWLLDATSAPKLVFVPAKGGE